MKNLTEKELEDAHDLIVDLINSGHLKMEIYRYARSERGYDFNEEKIRNISIRDGSIWIDNRHEQFR